MKNIKIPENWSGKEALIVHDFLADVMDAIWKNYEDSMVDVLQSEQNKQSEKDNWVEAEEFNDAIPF